MRQELVSEPNFDSGLFRPIGLQPSLQFEVGFDSI